MLASLRDVGVAPSRGNGTRLVNDYDGIDESASDNTLLWALTDLSGTVRDVVDSIGTVVSHIQYDSFGNRLAETNAVIDLLIGYTARQVAGRSEREFGVGKGLV